MRLHATIAGNKHAVDLQFESARANVEVDGRRYELDVHESGADSYLLITDGRVFDCRVEARPESGKAVNVVVGTTPFAVTLTDLKRLRGAPKTGAQTDEAAHIVAPMPGKIVRVLVEVGDQIEIGAGIVVVEAMKMQNEMKAPRAGTVVALSAQVGATVNSGDVLAVIE